MPRMYKLQFITTRKCWNKNNWSNSVTLNKTLTIYKTFIMKYKATKIIKNRQFYIFKVEDNLLLIMLIYNNKSQWVHSQHLGQATKILSWWPINSNYLLAAIKRAIHNQIIRLLLFNRLMQRHLEEKNNNQLIFSIL